MSHFEQDPFCPRHGRRSRPTLTPGLRCLCSKILMAAAGVTVADSIEDAFMLGFDQGTKGGVPADRVRECAMCLQPFYVRDVAIGESGKSVPSLGMCCDKCVSVSEDRRRSSE